ncbi:MAG: hypothetical protein ACRDX8_06910 [Acidimicrobiales bacterium]
MRLPTVLGRRWPVGVLCLVRAVWGAVELVRPNLAFGRVSGRPLESEEVPVVRVLGARQVAQALVSAKFPTPTVLRLGAVVDGLHSLSMVGAGLALSKYRRHALTSAGLAAAFALAGWVAK